MLPGAGDNGAMEEYGERLRTRARELGMTDVEVARRLGLAQARYSRYVNGEREPDLRTFVRICQVLSTTPDAILGVGRPAENAAEADRLHAKIDATLRTMALPTLRAAAAVIDALATSGLGTETGQE